MQTRDVDFFSDGLQLKGQFWLPDRLDETVAYPLVVICSGFTGLMSFHPARFARYLTKRGHVCFGFDYRGFVGSQGPRARVILEEQVRDTRHAVACAQADALVDESNVVLLGWGMGAGIVLDAARTLSGIVGLAGLNGFYSGLRLQQAHRTDAELEEFITRVHLERRKRATTGQVELVDPFDIYPLDPNTTPYVNSVLREEPGFEGESYSFEMADSLLGWNPEAYASEMAIPLLLAHGEENHLHPLSEATSLQAKYAGESQLLLLPETGHTEFMFDDNPTFQHLASELDDWIQARVGYELEPEPELNPSNNSAEVEAVVMPELETEE